MSFLLFKCAKLMLRYPIGRQGKQHRHRPLKSLITLRVCWGGKRKPRERALLAAFPRGLRVVLFSFFTGGCYLERISISAYYVGDIQLERQPPELVIIILMICLQLLMVTMLYFNPSPFLLLRICASIASSTAPSAYSSTCSNVPP